MLEQRLFVTIDPLLVGGNFQFSRVWIYLEKKITIEKAT